MFSRLIRVWRRVGVPEELSKRKPPSKPIKGPLADLMQAVRSGNSEMASEAAGRLLEQRSEYWGIGRVLATGYAYQEGMSKREYDPDNSTGFMTGQWIDVEVVEGILEFNGFHCEGEVIHGAWSYGGDVGIIGKPQVGNLVGYYRDWYCQIWEKLEGIDLPPRNRSR